MLSNCLKCRKNDYNTKFTDVENKTSSVTGLVTTTDVNTKATEIKNKSLILLILLQSLI